MITESGLELVATSDNVVMTRTFSKIYGLAGLRLGWAYCPSHVADVLNQDSRALQCECGGDGSGCGGYWRPEIY